MHRETIARSIQSLCERSQIVSTESVELWKVLGNTTAIPTRYGSVLGEDLIADRDSPPLDVSAMDGFAVRLSDLLRLKLLPIDTNIAAAGRSPFQLAPGSAVRIFTGGAVPESADCILMKEDAVESASEGTNFLHCSANPSTLKVGQHIRRKGENVKANETILRRGAQITPPYVAAIASFASERIKLHRPLAIAILNTGDELVPMGTQSQPWQIKDSNGPFLEFYLNRLAFVGSVARTNICDDRKRLEASIAESLEKCDALIMTGGVSMGDFDYVPDAIRSVGCEVVFHRLPIRPGKPILGAISDAGKPVIALPGNPVSVAVTFRRIALPILKHIAGIEQVDAPESAKFDKQLNSPPIDLVNFRLCEREIHTGKHVWTEMRGSGDIAALSRSEGFAELPVGSNGCGEFLVYRW